MSNVIMLIVRKVEDLGCSLGRAEERISLTDLGCVIITLEWFLSANGCVIVDADNGLLGSSYCCRGGRGWLPALRGRAQLWRGHRPFSRLLLLSWVR